MNFANVKGITIPEGAVKALSIGGVKVWDKLGGGTYTVTWKNHDGSVLEIDTNVPYGTVPTYNGADPTHTNPDYVWNGWSPAVGAITGDTTYTAQFKDTSYKYVKLINRSITEISSDVTSVGYRALSECTKLTTADFPVATRIGEYTFYGSYLLTALILRSKTMCSLDSQDAFSSTPIASGKGYIYVPAALVDSYKAKYPWSTYANQFRAIEDYPDICGGESA